MKRVDDEKESLMTINSYRAEGERRGRLTLFDMYEVEEKKRRRREDEARRTEYIFAWSGG